MLIGTPTLLLRFGARAALVLTALVGTADLATRVVFTTSTIQARAEEAIRRAPGPAVFVAAGETDFPR